LDKARGFYDFASADDIKAFAPTFTFKLSDLFGAGLIPKFPKFFGGLFNKRAWYDDLADGAAKLGGGIQDTFEQGKDVIIGATDKVVEFFTADTPAAFKAGVEVVVGAVTDLIDDISRNDPAVQGSAPINFGPSQNEDTPWGDGALLFKKESTSPGKVTADLSVYCIDCGVRGTVYLQGTAKWSSGGGVESVVMNVNADMTAGLQLGVVATANLNVQKTKQLVRAAVPNLGIVVNGIFSAGCYLGVDAVAEFDITAIGQALAGVSMHFPEFKATIDVTNSASASSSSVTGFQPTFKKRMEASGSITSTLTLSLPVSLNIGVEIIPLKQTRSFSLIERPSIVGQVIAAGTLGPADSPNEACNNGISYSLTVMNDIDLNVFGFKTISLSHLEPEEPLLSDCFQLPANSNLDALNNFLKEDTITFDSTSNNAASDTGPVIVNPEAQPNSDAIKALQEAGQAASTDAQISNAKPLSRIIEKSGAFSLAASGDGNLYATGSNAGSQFPVSAKTTSSDIANRAIFYQPDLMAAYGVSRIRIVDRNSVPRGANVLSLKQMDLGSGVSSVMAVDTFNKAYPLVVCKFRDNSPSKIFMVKDSSGVNALSQTYAFPNIMTGAVVSQCYVAQLIFA
jgi:hypothetical protein